MNWYEAIGNIKLIKCVSRLYTCYENLVCEKYLRATRFLEPVACVLKFANNVIHSFEMWVQVCSATLALVNPLPANRDYCQFYSVLLADEITDIGIKMIV